jgi:hypothetical protein
MLRLGRGCLMYETSLETPYLYIRNSALQDRGEQKALRAAPIGQETPARGCSYRRKSCAGVRRHNRTGGADGRGLRASGRVLRGPIQDPANGLRRIPIPRTRVNRNKRRKGRGCQENPSPLREQLTVCRAATVREQSQVAATRSNYRISPTPQLCCHPRSGGW